MSKGLPWGNPDADPLQDMRDAATGDGPVPYSPELIPFREACARVAAQLNIPVEEVEAHGRRLQGMQRLGFSTAGAGIMHQAISGAIEAEEKAAKDSKAFGVLGDLGSVELAARR
jgi:hypothetical protein